MTDISAVATVPVGAGGPDEESFLQAAAKAARARYALDERRKMAAPEKGGASGVPPSSSSAIPPSGVADEYESDGQAIAQARDAGLMEARRIIDAAAERAADAVRKRQQAQREEAQRMEMIAMIVAQFLAEDD